VIERALDKHEQENSDAIRAEVAWIEEHLL